MYWTYVLISLKDGRHYIGSTCDIKKRLREHNEGKSPSVKGRGPFKIVYKEIFSSRAEAVCRERQIKSYKGGAAFKELLAQKTIDPIV